jgi:diguanylate cyclase (GGDEF)-like protein
MIQYDLQIVHKLLDESISKEFVNSHLLWIEQICDDIMNKNKTPSVELDETECVLGHWLHNKLTLSLLDEMELQNLNRMHKKIHELGRSVYDSLNKEDYYSLLIDYSFLVRHSQHINYELHQVITQRDLLEKTQTDPLTKLANRKALEVRASNLQLEKNSQFCVAMVDLDHFKNINDTYGHLCGDFVLEKTAELLKNSLRKSDEVYRYGGEEFVIILQNTSLDEITEHLQKLCQVIKEHKFEYQKATFYVTTSIGVAQFDHTKHHSLTQIINDADQALYQAKTDGRDRVVLNDKNV